MRSRRDRRHKDRFPLLVNPMTNGAHKILRRKLAPDAALSRREIGRVDRSQRRGVEPVVDPAQVRAVTALAQNLSAMLSKFEAGCIGGDCDVRWGELISFIKTSITD